MNYNANKAKRYWFLSGLIVIAIVIGWLLPIQRQQRLWSQEVQVVLFATGLGCTALAVVFYAIQQQFRWQILGVVLALIAVGVLLLFRLGAPERSHLLEYAALAICIHQAMQIRFAFRLWDPALRAIILAGGIGFLDEAIQALLPNRTFAWEDVVFNLSTVVVAISGHVAYKAIRKWGYSK